MADVQVIALQSSGEGSFTVDLGDALVTLVCRFNYSAASWSMDILDAEGVVLVAGLMLVPNVDILIPYLDLKELLGSLVLVELNPNDYQSDALLGTNTKLLWYPPGVEIELP